MTFVKGKSGNPLGRAPNTGWSPEQKQEIRDIKSLARKHSLEAIETLVEVMKDKDASVAARVSAAQSILDRGWGKPHQTIDATVTNVYERMSDSELRESITRRIDRLFGGAGGSGTEGEPEGVRGISH